MFCLGGWRETILYLIRLFTVNTIPTVHLRHSETLLQWCFHFRFTMGKGQADKTPQQLKEEGNEAYKSGDLDTAIVKYTEVGYANNLDISMFTLFSLHRGIKIACFYPSIS